MNGKRLIFNDFIHSDKEMFVALLIERANEWKRKKNFIQDKAE